MASGNMTGSILPLTKHRKMPKLVETARIKKRPLHRPAIPSAYTSSAESKVVYVSAKTPFMSAVKRIDKLLHLAEKRDVQSATAIVRNESQRKRRRMEDGKAEEINSIVRTLTERESREEVVVKGTGKAIAKALELGLWFQQRQQYTVKLQTGTVDSIDDIEIDGNLPTTIAKEKHSNSDSMDITPEGQPEAGVTVSEKEKNVTKTGHAPNGHFLASVSVSAKEDDAAEPEYTPHGHAIASVALSAKEIVDGKPGSHTEAPHKTPNTKRAFFQDSGQRDETRIRSVSVIEIRISLK